MNHGKKHDLACNVLECKILLKTSAAASLIFQSYIQKEYGEILPLTF